MDSFQTLKKDWVLNQAALDRLLSCLGEDLPSAAEKYESIRKRLITFFQCRGCPVASEYADETIDRVARRLTEGLDIHTVDPASFFFGVARKVLKEHWDKAGKDPISIQSIRGSEHLLRSYDTLLSEPGRFAVASDIQSLDQCLAELPNDSRQLILRYYEGDSSQKIVNRRIIAQELGVSLNTLRIRAMRIREKLELCLARRAKPRSNS